MIVFSKFYFIIRWMAVIAYDRRSFPGILWVLENNFQCCKSRTVATKRRPGSTTSVRRFLKGAGTQVLEIHRLGSHPLIHFFLEQLGVTRILDKHIHSNREGKLSHGEAISLLVHNACWCPGTPSTD